MHTLSFLSFPFLFSLCSHRPFIRFVAPKVYVILRLLRLCPSRNRSFSLAPVGVKASAQAQRWMNKANKDLDQQLKNTPLSSVNPQQ
eukprot:m.44104 g.44104  ORF g.44104 m.44104 type:complete len:87 (+) comp10583_c0_seq9:56-316(+)